MYLDKYDLSGRTAFLTGGGRGIGLARAEALREAGARRSSSPTSTRGCSRRGGPSWRQGHARRRGRARRHRPAAVARAAADANARYGAVDILIANAGIAWPDTGGEDMADEAWLKVIDVDLNGCFLDLPRVRPADAGPRPRLDRHRRLDVGLISNKPQRQAHYNAAKAAVHHMTRSLAGEWAERGVRVNAVAPTYVDTLMSRGGFNDPG